MKTRSTVVLLILWSVCLLCHGHATGCELMGFSFSEDVPAGQLLSAFSCRGEKNPDGWGVAFYSDNSVTLFKEAADASKSALAEFLRSYDALDGRLLVAHVRDATVGGQSHQNTHPFARELGGKEYTLAHNGTLEDFKDKLPLSGIKPLGTTDSEHILCYLLGRIQKKGVGDWNTESFEWLKGELDSINQTGTLNCLFSDGTYLFSYHDKEGYNELHHLKRVPPHGKVFFKDLSREVELSGMYPESAVGVIVATRPLTDEQWVEFLPGQLLVFKDGTQVFPTEK
ncbi:MAG: class II glutamine amidotransferase [Candidatus Eiseniibacteriota bacterium]|nr:MAG: class II glutamine amidotransferase [Candidatus Eisenbacteria bacterium]